MKNIIDIVNKIDEDNFNIVKKTPYVFDNHYVPRVTNIISDMINEEYLMGWSNYLGFKRQKYKEVLEEAAQKGTYTHDYIENYIKKEIEPDIENIPVQYRSAVRNAYSSFRVWWDLVTSNNEVEIIYQEIPLVCKWFGGTLDLLLKINGKIYLIDFKTSNHPSYKHFIQLSAYTDMLKNLHGIEIDGCGTIMLSKDKIHFTEILLDLTDDTDVRFMSNCRDTFYSLVYSYYNRLRVELDFKAIIKRVE